MISFSNKKIVMITGRGEYPLMVYNYLINHFYIEKFIVEEPESKAKFLKRRIKRLGLLHVLSQVTMRILVVTFLKLSSKKRIKEIIKFGDLKSNQPDPKIIINIPSANSKECIQLLQDINPDLVVIVNTRILSEKILNAVPAKFINIHAGITPKYRGMHGEYWALVNNDQENCGITVHLVDKGIDTGEILYQDTIKITKKDNYYTYPYLLLNKGLPLLKKAITDILNQTVKTNPKPKNMPSKLYYHPTTWQYLSNRVLRKVK